MTRSACLLAQVHCKQREWAVAMGPEHRAYDPAAEADAGAGAAAGDRGQQRAGGGDACGDTEELSALM